MLVFVVLGQGLLGLRGLCAGPWTWGDTRVLKDRAWGKL